MRSLDHDQLQKLARTPIWIWRGLLPCVLVVPQFEVLWRLMLGLAKSRWFITLVMIPENSILTFSETPSLFLTLKSTLRYPRPLIRPAPPLRLSRPSSKGRTLSKIAAGFWKKLTLPLEV